MQLNLNQVPFMRRGSYMVISRITENFRFLGRGMNNKEGLYLRTVHGDSRFMPLIGRLVPLKYGETINYDYTATPSELCLYMDGGEIRICYGDENTILVCGTGKGVGLCISDLSADGIYDYIHEIHRDDRVFYEANLFKNAGRYMFSCSSGKISIDQIWNGQTAEKCCVRFEEKQGHFCGVIEEVRREYTFKTHQFYFSRSVHDVETEYLEHLKKMPEIPKKLAHLRELAAYINWGNTVKKEGILTREAIYASKNWMTTVFSWEHCFTSMVLAYHAPRQAFDQFMLMFDYQDETGRLPDCITDTSVAWNFTKPPFHGFTFLKMMEHMEFTQEQLQTVYTKLCRWTIWWYIYRDSDKDGSCEYHHGNDSGWDNATIFKDTMVIESPELSAFLILQAEALSAIAEKLNRKEEVIYWREKERKQMNALLSHGFIDGRPVARVSCSHEIVDCHSLIPYEVIVLGKRLPKDITDSIVRILQEEFLTEWGLSTENVTSPLYEADGYWRGPIWAAPLLLIVDGLNQLGEDALVDAIIRRYIKLVEKSGFSENYNALTGEGNRDRGYEWAASAFLIMMHEYGKRVY